MSAEETVIAVAAGTGAAVVAKTINTNKLADKLSKTRKTRWFRWVDINVPNNFAESDAHVADPNIIANAPTLETLGKLVTVGKYSIVVIMALSLTVFYGIQYTVFVGDYKPSSFADYNRFLAIQPGLRCSCGVQTSPFSNFATASVEMNPTCAWVIQDLISYDRERACPVGGGGSDELGQCHDLSTCRSAGQLPLCKATDESCKQSNQTIEWILQEFRNTPVSSTEMLAQDTLEKLANQTFESAIKLGSLISTTPVKTVEAWASANAPNFQQPAWQDYTLGIMNLLKNFTRIAMRAGIFDNATAAERKIYMDAVYTYSSRAVKEPDGLKYYDVHDFDDPIEAKTKPWGATGQEFKPFVQWDDFPDGVIKHPCEGVYWETKTGPTPATDYMEINEMLDPYTENSAWNSEKPSYMATQGCTYRKCYYDCSFNGQTFTDWDGDYANIPSWVPYDKTQNNNGDLHWMYQTMDYYPAGQYSGYTMPGLTCTKTREGPLWRNDFEQNTQGGVPVPPWPEYRFNQSATSGCDAYSVALDTTYFAYDTPERFLLIKNASWDTMDKHLKDKAKAAGKPEPQFDGWGPGSGIDYVEKFAVPIMKRHGTVRNAISNLFIDEKVVSVNYEDYFNTCAITTCTYTYSARLSTAALTSVIFGLIGGIVAFMNLFGGFVYDACKAAVLRGVEEATGHETPHEDETEGSDAPAVPKSRA